MNYFLRDILSIKKNKILSQFYHGDATQLRGIGLPTRHLKYFTKQTFLLTNH
jgi:hypothetical protein